MEKNINLLGKKVTWTYQHHLNSRSFVTITKEGVVVGACRNENYVKIKFKGNKNAVKKHKSDLIEDEIENMQKEIIGNHVLYCGDCRDIIANIRDKSLDLILIDPPF